MVCDQFFKILRIASSLMSEALSATSNPLFSSFMSLKQTGQKPFLPLISQFLTPPPPLILDAHQKCELPVLAELHDPTYSDMDSSDCSTSIWTVKSLNSCFPILAILLKEPEPLNDILRQSGKKAIKKKGACNQSKISKNLVVGVGSEQGKRKKKVKVESQSSAIQYKPVKSVSCFQIKEKAHYKVAYRIGFSHSLKFKFIDISVPGDFSVDQFSSCLLDCITSDQDFLAYSVYVEKERDLVPLIDKRQLYSHKVNYLHIRQAPQTKTSIEKPVLLKKRNIPAIGMTLLDDCEPKILKSKVAIQEPQIRKCSSSF